MEQFRFQYPPSALFTLSAMQWLRPTRLQINDVIPGSWPTINYRRRLGFHSC